MKWSKRKPGAMEHVYRQLGNNHGWQNLLLPCYQGWRVAQFGWKMLTPKPKVISPCSFQAWYGEAGFHDPMVIYLVKHPYLYLCSLALINTLSTSSSIQFEFNTKNVQSDCGSDSSPYFNLQFPTLFWIQTIPWLWFTIFRLHWFGF